MNIEISKERMLEMAKKLASMDFCPEQRVFYKNILRMVKADVEGRLLVLPCKVGKYEKSLVDLEKAMDESTLYDWYVTSVKQTDTPVWTGEHIEELLNDFYVIPKDEEDGTRKTTVAKTHDGIWKLDTKILKMKVTHWMPLPELPKEVLE